MQLIAFALLLQADADALYKFKAGTSWTYEKKDGGPGGVVTMTVSGVDKDGRVSIDQREQILDAQPRLSKQAWFVKDGLLHWVEISNSGTDTPFLDVYKVGSRKGDSWKTAFPMGEADAKHMGVEEVKVGAGTYKNAVHVRIAQGPASIDVWLAPGVGMVKSAMKPPMGPAVEMSLKEFKAVK